MGGSGSGRKSVKFEAVKCLISVQMDIWELLSNFDDNKMTRDELKEAAAGAYKKMKVTQEEIERL